MEQAAAAWRAWVGDAAEHAEPHAVEDAGVLSLLRDSDITGDTKMGHESRSVLDNWFRAARRLDDLDDALRKLRVPLPQPRALYQDVDIEPMTTEFLAWYTPQHDQTPRAEAVEDLAREWQEGSLPETRYLVSPDRLRHVLALISDWPEDEITAETVALLPKWARWLGERAELPDRFLQRVLDAAQETPQSAASRV